ncbi:recombinase family protein [Caproicibacter fermentans]|uniref:Recombinase family protein n=1 Tax=Caproicibacter fermentans TaxID=2576756 RepID=A0A7G8TF83_9FIRM|nr:recombinase family protein [Caproicibacter fermentans]QNK42274.1 recombinase family protein [Caproicibacter fermentans]
MARKSRIYAQPLNAALPIRVYKTGLYVRLSVIDSGKVDSDTVQNQESLLRAYMADKTEFSLYEVYIDNGETGVNFKRDAFERLIQDVRNGKVDCIIVKDLSRFGRNYIEAGEYLEKIFPFLGVRFIAINDRYDSADPATSDILTMHLKNLVNAVYASDISRKICPVLKAKQERGEFIGAWASYGYRKAEDDKHQLMVDDNVAYIVRDIFQWRLLGMSYQMIARKLNELGIPSPSKYRYEQGFIKEERLKDLPWRVATIKSIIRNEIYLGHMVQGKKREALWKGQKQSQVPKEQWIVVKNTHEAIIDERTFYQVQRVNEQANADYYAKLERFSGIQNTENILKGLVYCGNCGKNLVRYKNVRENRHTEPKYHVWYNYICPIHSGDPASCPFTSIPEKDLLNTVFTVIQSQLAIAVDMEKLIRSAKRQSFVTAERQRLQSKMRQTIDEVEGVIRHRETLYEDYSEKLMTEQDYVYVRNRYKEKEAELRRQLEQLKTEENSLRESTTEENPWLSAFLRFRDEAFLTREMAEELIERIIVYSRTNVKIELRFGDEYQKLQEELSPMLEVAVNG